jgi:hypothetical protein
MFLNRSDSGIGFIKLKYLANSEHLSVKSIFSIGRLLNIRASHMTYELFSVCILGGMEYLTRSRDEAEAGHEP